MTKAKTKGKDLIGDIEKAIKKIKCELTQEQKDLCDQLTQRELVFANLVLTIPIHGMTKPECYWKAGYNKTTTNTASVTASRILKNAQVWEYMRSVNEGGMKRTILSLDYLDAELKGIVDADTVMASVKRVKDIPESIRGAIQYLKTDEDGLIVDYKMYSRLDAMKLGMQRKGALTDRKEISGIDGGPIEIQNMSDGDLNNQLAAMITVTDEH